MKQHIEYLSVYTKKYINKYKIVCYSLYLQGEK